MQQITIERALSNAAASLRMEGFSITAQQTKLAKQVLSGKMTLAECLPLLNKSPKED